MKKRIINSQGPYVGLSLVLGVMVQAVRCIRRTETAYGRAMRGCGGRCREQRLAAEAVRQREQDMPVRERLVEVAESRQWFAGQGMTDRTREALMTLLMWLVALDDRTEIEYERARGRSRRGRLRGLRKSFYDFIKRFKHGGD